LSSSLIWRAPAPPRGLSPSLTLSLSPSLPLSRGGSGLGWSGTDYSANS
jgi:hypothetical protein